MQKTNVHEIDVRSHGLYIMTSLGVILVPIVLGTVTLERSRCETSAFCSYGDGDGRRTRSRTSLVDGRSNIRYRDAVRR